MNEGRDEEITVRKIDFTIGLEKIKNPITVNTWQSCDRTR